MDFQQVDSEFPFLAGSWIPKLDSGFQSPVFWIPQANISWIPESGLPYMGRHIRLHPDNINRNSGIEIPEAWMPKIKKHNNRRAVRQRIAKGTNRPYRLKKTSSMQSKRRDLHHT